MSDEDIQRIIRPTGAYRTVRARWWVVVVTGLLFGVLTLVFSGTRAKYYDAVGELFLGPGGYSLPVASAQPSQRVNTLAALACSDLVLEPAGQASGADLTGGSERSVSCTPQQDSQVIQIVVRSSTAAQSVRIANAVSDSFKKVATESSPPNTQVGANNNVLYPNSPVAYFTVRTPTAPSTPQPARDAIFGTLLGAAICVLVLGLYGLRKERVAGPRRSQSTASIEDRSRAAGLGTTTHPHDVARDDNAKGLSQL